MHIVDSSVVLKMTPLVLEGRGVEETCGLVPLPFYILTLVDMKGLATLLCACLCISVCEGPSMTI